MNGEDAVALVFVFVAACYLVARALRHTLRRKAHDCASGCSGCKETVAIVPLHAPPTLRGPSQQDSQGNLNQDHQAEPAHERPSDLAGRVGRERVGD